jgi:uncharacterized membrane protein (DUF373 family)
MKYLRDIEREYELTEKDRENLKIISEKLLKYKSEFTKQFIEYLNKRVSMEYSGKDFFSNVEKMVDNWYVMLMNCDITNDYVFKLINASKIHIKYNISLDSINAMTSFTRRFLHEKMFQNFTNDVERKDLLITLHKILDINVDILNRAYLEEKIKEYSLEFRFRGLVVKLGEKFSLVMQVVLIGILVLLATFATISVVYDIINLSINKSHETLISTLGSLLILWILAELIRTEIQLIKGGDFRISVFIGVALIAYIRDLLILTLQQHMYEETTIYVISAILILGIIYWLIYKTENTSLMRRKL